MNRVQIAATIFMLFTLPAAFAQSLPNDPKTKTPSMAPTGTPKKVPPTALPTLSPLTSPKVFKHTPNTYCEYYSSGGDGPCESGRPFHDVWQQCEEDGIECMGVMWNSCTGPTSDISVNGAWKLMSEGQKVGDANNPTETCGGKNQALGHWDVFEKPYIHIPNTYCEYYSSGGDGPCESGRSFHDVWQQCEDDGNKCMGVVWNSCTGPTSDISVNGAWKLMSEGQKVGDANNPTETCGGKDQALGHWDVFLRKYTSYSAESPSSAPSLELSNSQPSSYLTGGLNQCEILRLELIAGCAALIFIPFFGPFISAGCTAAAAVAWKDCFDNLEGRRLETAYNNKEDFEKLCGDSCLKMLRTDIGAPADLGGPFESHSFTEEEVRNAYNEGLVYGYQLTAEIEERR